MGRYSLCEINNSIENCKRFLKTVKCDMYTRMFWLCSLWMLEAAKVSGLCIVNNSVTASVYHPIVARYRNSYAHNEDVDALYDDIHNLLDIISEDMLFDSEVCASVDAIRKELSGV